MHELRSSMEDAWRDVRVKGLIGKGTQRRKFHAVRGHAREGDNLNRTSGEASAAIDDVQYELTARGMHA
jgi:hypothetical protein